MSQRLSYCLYRGPNVDVRWSYGVFCDCPHCMPDDRPGSLDECEPDREHLSGDGCDDGG